MQGTSGRCSHKTVMIFFAVFHIFHWSPGASSIHQIHNMYSTCTYIYVYIYILSIIYIYCVYFIYIFISLLYHIYQCTYMFIYSYFFLHIYIYIHMYIYCEPPILRQTHIKVVSQMVESTWVTYIDWDIQYSDILRWRMLLVNKQIRMGWGVNIHIPKIGEVDVNIQLQSYR